MSTKDIEKRNRLKAASDKIYQELKESMSNLEKAIDEAHISISQHLDKIERLIIERMNKRLEAANKEVNRIDQSLENEMKSYSGTQTTDYADTEIVTVDISELTTNVDISEKIVVEDQINLYENECDYDEHDDNMSDLDDFESFNIINESEDSFSFDTKFSELSTIEEQSELEIVNDIEVDWNKNIIFKHLTIESQPISMEQQPMEVECLGFHSKCYAEMTSVANVSSVGTDLNSFAKFEKGFTRQVWDPGLTRDEILL